MVRCRWRAAQRRTADARHSRRSWLEPSLPLPAHGALCLSATHLLRPARCGQFRVAQRPPKNWNVPRYLAEIDALRSHLGIDSLIMFGNSWGGTIAAAYAARRPPGLTKLILSGPLIDTRRWVADNAVYRAALPAGAQEATDRYAPIALPRLTLTPQLPRPPGAACVPRLRRHLERGLCGGDGPLLPAALVPAGPVARLCGGDFRAAPLQQAMLRGHVGTDGVHLHRRAPRLQRLDGAREH